MHTPGPWTYGSRFIEGAGDKIVLEARRDMTVDDARMIAAAPDMLAALKLMVTWMPSGFAPQSQEEALEAAYAAIARAEGK